MSTVLHPETMQNLVASNIRGKSQGMSHISIPICLKTSKSTETTMHHVITHIQEAVENRKLHLGFPRY